MMQVVLLAASNVYFVQLWELLYNQRRYAKCHEYKYHSQCKIFASTGHIYKHFFPFQGTFFGNYNTALPALHTKVP